MGLSSSCSNVLVILSMFFLLPPLVEGDFRSTTILWSTHIAAEAWSFSRLSSPESIFQERYSSHQLGLLLHGPSAEDVSERCAGSDVVAERGCF